MNLRTLLYIIWIAGSAALPQLSPGPVTDWLGPVLAGIGAMVAYLDKSSGVPAADLTTKDTKDTKKKDGRGLPPAATIIIGVLALGLAGCRSLGTPEQREAGRVQRGKNVARLERFGWEVFTQVATGLLSGAANQWVQRDGGLAK